MCTVFENLPVPRRVILLQIVVGVPGAVDSVGAGVEIVVHRLGRIAQAERTGSLGIGSPQSSVVTIGNAKLHQPLVVELDCRDQSRVGERVDRIEQRVAEKCSCWAPVAPQFQARR